MGNILLIGARGHSRAVPTPPAGGGQAQDQMPFPRAEPRNGTSHLYAAAPRLDFGSFRDPSADALGYAYFAAPRLLISPDPLPNADSAASRGAAAYV
jgi:hypothetical protein